MLAVPDSAASATSWTSTPAWPLTTRRSTDAGCDERLEADQPRAGEAPQREERELAAVGADVEHRARLVAEEGGVVLDRGGDAVAQPAAVIAHREQAHELDETATTRHQPAV